jgi:hypothetical protein
MMLTDAALTVRARVAVCVCAGLLESVTLKMSGAFVTACVGVPVMAPVAAFSVSAVGIVPLVRLQVYGAVPPVAVSIAL